MLIAVDIKFFTCVLKSGDTSYPSYSPVNYAYGAVEDVSREKSARGLLTLVLFEYDVLSCSREYDKATTIRYDLLRASYEKRINTKIVENS